MFLSKPWAGLDNLKKRLIALILSANSGSYLPHSLPD
jgi:hypothetical protein